MYIMSYLSCKKDCTREQARTKNILAIYWICRLFTVKIMRDVDFFTAGSLFILIVFLLGLGHLMKYGLKSFHFTFATLAAF